MPAIPFPRCSRARKMKHYFRRINPCAWSETIMKSPTGIISANVTQKLNIAQFFFSLFLVPFFFQTFSKLLKIFLTFGKMCRWLSVKKKKKLVSIDTDITFYFHGKHEFVFTKLWTFMSGVFSFSILSISHLHQQVLFLFILLN